MQTGALEGPRQVTEFELIARAIRREEGAVREIIRRYNQRLYRLARSILRDDSEAEDALQEAYLRAFSQLSSFRGEEPSRPGCDYFAPIQPVSVVGSHLPVVSSQRDSSTAGRGVVRRPPDRGVCTRFRL